MILENKLNITDQVELAKAEEKISKQKARQLFDSGDITKAEIGTFAGLTFIHGYLFEDIYPFAGKIRDVNIAKGEFRFVPLMYLEPSLKHIDAMPQGTFEQIIEKYVEMNVAHPFMEGNGRSMRIWLDLILKKNLKLCVDWSKINKKDYLDAMEKSVTNSAKIKALLQSSLTDRINDREMFMKGIDYSYYYEQENEITEEEWC